jgi:hypothetical protein
MFSIISVLSRVGTSFKKHKCGVSLKISVQKVGRDFEFQHREVKVNIPVL